MELYSTEAIKERRELRTTPEVTAAIDEVWQELVMDDMARNAGAWDAASAAGAAAAPGATGGAPSAAAEAATAAFFKRGPKEHEGISRTAFVTYMSRAARC